MPYTDFHEEYENMKFTSKGYAPRYALNVKKPKDSHAHSFHIKKNCKIIECNS